MYPLSSLNDVSPASLSDMKDLYAIFAVEYVKNYGEKLQSEEGCHDFYTGNYLLLRSKV